MGLSNLVQSIRNIMRKNPGVSGGAQHLTQMAQLSFDLKYLKEVVK